MAAMTGEAKPFWKWERLAREGRIEEAIVEYVRMYDWVTFVELQRQFEPYCETRGDVALEAGPNLILWAGLSPGFAAALESLLARRLLFAHPASLLTYFIDGGFLSLPVAKRPPPGGYKKPRWAPACLRQVPPPGAWAGGKRNEAATRRAKPRVRPAPAMPAAGRRKLAGAAPPRPRPRAAASALRRGGRGAKRAEPR